MESTALFFLTTTHFPRILLYNKSLCERCVLTLFPNKQMYGRYTQELGVYAKEEAARLRDGGGLRRNTSVRGRSADVLEYQKDPCAKCQCK